MDADDVEAWFASYLRAFTAMARGELDPARILDYYAVPLVLCLETGSVVIDSATELVDAMAGSFAGLRAVGYDRSDQLRGTVSLLNAACATYTGEFVRRAADGTLLETLGATYVITDGAAGRRISLLAASPAPARA